MFSFASYETKLELYVTLITPIGLRECKGRLNAQEWRNLQCHSTAVMMYRGRPCYHTHNALTNTIFVLHEEWLHWTLQNRPLASSFIMPNLVMQLYVKILYQFLMCDKTVIALKWDFILKSISKLLIARFLWVFHSISRNEIMKLLIL
jgi:hypothetical protein